MSTAIHLALRTRAESCSGFPTAREHENVVFTPPVDGSMWSEEDFIPATNTLTAISTSGPREARGLYVIRLFATANSGIKTLRDLATALVEWFAPSWCITLGDNTKLRTRTDALPYAGQITNTATRAMCVVTIPWRAEVPRAA